MLDGIRRRLTSAAWWDLSDAEANDVMADAIDDLFVAMTTRPGSVENPGGLLWTIVYRRGVDHVRRAAMRAQFGDEHDDDRHHPDLRREAFDDEAERLARVRHALSVARSLLPQLGNTTMQRVMGYWFDAAEHGVEQVDDKEVAAAFSYNPEQVRKARERGFSRLERIGRELGIVDSLDIPGRPTGADSEDDDVSAEE